MILCGSGDFVKNCDRDYNIDNEGFHGFVGCIDLFDDFSLSVAILCGLFSLFQYLLTL
jgi:hypothetical protein